MQRFVTGQRWMSETEPELGLGLVLECADGRVLIQFPASREQRRYAIDTAPLRRVVFRSGQRIAAGDGSAWRVASVAEHEGRLTYHGEDGQALPEAQLSDALGSHSPDERLLHGQIDSRAAFELRREALRHQHRRRQSPVRGFVGGRMDLIPHQLYIAREVTSRHAPRVLLADEVGLGKTIEACLILHRLLATGRAARVLIVVPESLVHQWFVELLRRFNLWFQILDEEGCDALEEGDAEANGFLETQLLLCGLPLLLKPRPALQAIEAGWDLLVVDEAHHLRWSPDQASPEYRIIEAIGRRSEGLLLLTATPEQLGLASHFARLRLLDPDRYHDFQQFVEEIQRFGDVAVVANKLVSEATLMPSDLERLHDVLRLAPGDPNLRPDARPMGGIGAREEMIAELLDRHGPGRVMFRNTRAAIRGFPRRLPRPVPLPSIPAEPGLLEKLAIEFEADLTADPEVAFDFARDPRVGWLVELLRRLKDEKVLLIASSRAKVLALEEALRSRVAVKTALFHEGLELIQRDRNAAWFADPEGARILLASEIGSEGRNFQFAHHLVLFDLPLDPELVEQRIGRLDRIGQTTNIEIHVPYVADSPQEVLFRWFHEGLDAFGHHLVAGRELREQFAREIQDLAQDFHETHEARRPELNALLRRTREAREKLELRLEQGRDRLLELNSFRPAPAHEIVTAIAALDQDPTLEGFLLRVWDQVGIPVEDINPRCYRIGGEAGSVESFPGLPQAGLITTFDRQIALGREDLAFLTWDHPLVTGALDLLLGGPRGSCSFVAWTESRERGLWWEAIYLVECVAPLKLHPDRFLPATPLCVIVDAQGRDVTALATQALARATLVDVPVHEFLDDSSLRARVPDLVAASERVAQEKAGPIVAKALFEVDRQLGHERERLRALAAVNPSVRPEEVRALDEQHMELRRHVSQARRRLDAVRLILLG